MDHSKSPLVASWPWNSSLLTGTHLLTVTVAFTKETSRNGTIHSSPRTIRQSFSIHLSSKPPSDVSSTTRAGVRKLESEPIQSTLLQLFLLLFFLYLLVFPAPTWSSRLRLFQRNRSLVLLYFLSIAGLLGGVFVGGKMTDGFFIAFQWGSFSVAGNKWEFAHWRDVSLWAMYECFLCILPLFLYSLLQVRKPHCYETWFRLLRCLCLTFPVSFTTVMWTLFLGNYPLNCVLLSVNALWLPPILLTGTVKLCKESRIRKDSIVFPLCYELLPPT